MINPYAADGECNSRGSQQNKALVPFTPPLDSWKPIKDAFTSGELEVPKFDNSHIVTYFVTRSVVDGLPAGDFKLINSSAVNLFKSGHVQNIEVSFSSPTLYMRASCLPEMKKHTMYKLNLSFDSVSFHLNGAACGCPAGMGPNGSCKHIGALCYAFASFCEIGTVPDYITCTERLLTWNQPRGPKITPLPVQELTSRRNEISEKHVASSVIFDTRHLIIKQLTQMP